MISMFLSALHLERVIGEPRRRQPEQESDRHHPSDDIIRPAHFLRLLYRLDVEVDDDGDLTGATSTHSSGAPGRR